METSSQSKILGHRQLPFAVIGAGPVGLAAECKEGAINRLYAVPLNNTWSDVGGSLRGFAGRFVS